MHKIKVALFDADGVLALPEDFFSVMYARSHGLDPGRFGLFFKEVFPEAIVGQADLKELIAQHRHLWQWDDDIDELLKLWFESENVRNEPLLAIIRSVRQKGAPCYLATNQERYRGKYLRDVMFKEEFDGYFISAFMGVAKPDPQFFGQVIEALKQEDEELRAANIIYFDDSPSSIKAAERLGINAHLYKSVDQVKELLL